MTKKTYIYIVSGMLSFPALAFGATKTLSDLVKTIVGYLNQALVLMMALALIFFVWFVIKYYIRPNEERKEGHTYIMFSIIGFFVILSVWGLVNILTNTFGLESQAPTLNTLQNLFPGGNNSNPSPSGGLDPRTGQPL